LTHDLDLHEHDLDIIKMNQGAKCLGHRSFRMTVIVRTHAHGRPTALPEPQKIIINDCRDMFDIRLPSVQLSQRFDAFMAKWIIDYYCIQTLADYC